MSSRSSKEVWQVRDTVLTPQRLNKLQTEIKKTGAKQVAWSKMRDILLTLPSEQANEVLLLAGEKIKEFDDKERVEAIERQVKYVNGLIGNFNNSVQRPMNLWLNTFKSYAKEIFKAMAVLFDIYNPEDDILKEWELIQQVAAENFDEEIRSISMLKKIPFKVRVK